MPTHLKINREIVRQGDVLIIPIDTVADKHLAEIDTEGEGKRIVLAHGEATGHAHAIYPDLDRQARIAESDTSPPCVYKLANPTQFSKLPARLLRIKTRALLRHEEHSPISLPPGDYLVIQQHEGDEIGNLRKVSD